MDIHELISKFVELGDVSVGYGPRHPLQPNVNIEKDIQDFWSKYPILKCDPGYVDFLECYAGASLSWRDDNLAIDIFGFTYASTHITKEDGPIVDANGFFKFCDGIVRTHESTKGLKDVLGLGFSYDVTGNRRRGIYWNKTTDEGESSMSWYCFDFLEWFETMILAAELNK